MTDEATRRCPDAMTLAAFAEGSLEPWSRREIERHIADCPECPLVVARTVEFLKGDAVGGEDNAEPSSGWSWRWVAAAAIAALCVPAVVWQVTIHRDPLRRVKRIAAESGTRTIEGRLAGFDHAPFTPVRSKATPAADIELAAEVERLGRETGDDARSLHARGVALLLSGDAVSATRLLARAAALNPRNAAIANDLSVAYLQFAAVRNRNDLTTALAAATRATLLAPDFAAAHFNRAVALEHLGKGVPAIREYEQAAQLDPRSAWAEESLRRVAELRE